MLTTATIRIRSKRRTIITTPTAKSELTLSFSVPGLMVLADLSVVISNALLEGRNIDYRVKATIFSRVAPILKYHIYIITSYLSLLANY